jgi:hypothetical protein
MKVLWMHIGLDKMGTTALQTIFAINSRVLTSLGLCYMKAGRLHFMNHHHLHADALENKYIEWEKLHNELLALPENIEGVISFEGFYHLPVGSIETIAAIFKNCEIRVVIYLRRQSDLVCSGFAQRAKNRKMLLNIPEDKVIDHTQNYLRILKKWEAVFGKENIKVRLYDKLAMKEKNILVDFLFILNKEVGVQEVQEKFYLPKANVNPTFDVESLHVLKILDEAKELEDKTLYQGVVNFLLGQANNDRSTFLSDTIMSDINQYYQPTNTVIAKRWFKRNNLFISSPVFKYRLPDWGRVEQLKKQVRELYSWLNMGVWQGQKSSVATLYKKGMLFGFPCTFLNFPLFVSEEDITLVIRVNPPAMCDLSFTLEGTWKKDSSLTITVNGECLFKSSDNLIKFIIGSDIYAKKGKLLFLNLAMDDIGKKNKAVFQVEKIQYTKILDKT